MHRNPYDFLALLGVVGIGYTDGETVLQQESLSHILKNGEDVVGACWIQGQEILDWYQGFLSG
jgi:hypothetical protein